MATCKYVRGELKIDRWLTTGPDGTNMPTVESIRTSDGRDLCIEQAGDPLGRPIVILFGTPSSRLVPFRPHGQCASQLGARLISYDRPGYGGSSIQPGRRVRDAATDVQTIADAFGIDQLAVWGFSGGGPHALACAALLPTRVVAAVILASPGPDSSAGRSQPSDEAALMLSDPVAARANYQRQRQLMLHVTPDQLAQRWRAGAPGMDEQAIVDFVEFRVATYRSGLGPGIDGWWDDDYAILQPWGFDLATISQPVLLRHGDQDLNVPFQQATALAAQLPNVQTDYTNDNHLSLICQDPAGDFSWLLSHF
jgi:pimeloyl-ACP methyl ester carboxylesterase